MMTKRLCFIFCCLLLSPLFLAACSVPGFGGKEYQPLRLQDAPWQAGEVSEYKITDRNDDYAGTLLYEIRAGSDDVGREIWAIQRTINALDDKEIVEVIVTADGYRPQSSSLLRISAKGSEAATAVYNSGQVDIELTSVQNVVTPERMNVPSDVRDRRTLPMLARTMPLEEGYRTRLNVFLPIAGLIERAHVLVSDEESLDTLTGSVAVWRVDFQMQNSRIVAWVAVDPPHELLKFTDSRNGATYELVSYRPDS